MSLHCKSWHGWSGVAFPFVALMTHIFPSNWIFIFIWAIELERASQQATINMANVKSNSPTNRPYIAQLCAENKECFGSTNQAAKFIPTHCANILHILWMFLFSNHYTITVYIHTHTEFQPGWTRISYTWFCFLSHSIKSLLVSNTNIINDTFLVSVGCLAWNKTQYGSNSFCLFVNDAYEFVVIEKSCFNVHAASIL